MPHEFLQVTVFDQIKKLINVQDNLSVKFQKYQNFKILIKVMVVNKNCRKSDFSDDKPTVKSVLLHHG